MCVCVCVCVCVCYACVGLDNKLEITMFLHVTPRSLVLILQITQHHTAVVLTISTFPLRTERRV